ncbi:MULTISPECIES: 2'-5' RNA ligase family protein [Bacillus cereus group]|uniref:2'-5' RNA ligase family protein n=1 Tax=Bacillus TaxID=1386 RepID=UPI0009444A9D|nr:MULTISPECIES: 2'-5' RNA ligase family protein [Bacillus cereus group]MBL3821312.1 2'-5' RNA ligase family protein [Bacillus cereus]MCU5470397.1 2'-5' RNA ligase family protein [Bacillus paranthracis]MDA1886629.1 2'-5' RNA ligase family protein [Bacillus cereus group sp. BY105LC]MED1612274.1 2'-5' RNA ligase family protein [Bacillus paranthracis]MED1684197.1 2'-5' RNA ligase family protein [Bacillus paranthracis]
MRTILFFLNNMSIDKIENIRQKHDPLFGLIPPHITIVFPFKSNISSDALKSHILNLSKGVGEIEVEFANHITNVGNYLFFEVEGGRKPIEELHDMLYTGPLIQFLKEDIPYLPHVTVGRKESAELAAEVAKDIHSLPEKLQCVIDRISVERIGENGESIIEFEVPLQKS